MASSRNRDCEEIRVTGLTTPDKPVAKRSSTVPVRGRVAKKRTNMGPASLRHRSTLLRMPLFVSLTPSYRDAPSQPSPLPLYVFILHPCSSACPDTSRHGSKSSPGRVPRKKRTLTDNHLISTTVNVIFANLIHFPLPLFLENSSNL